ncbi:MAG: hypothetical protein F6J93_06635 [Oscillatoria sp. SIO1A7]|nr:hypothetical protein [Oscillatoria sp. SIO1A7]
MALLQQLAWMREDIPPQYPRRSRTLSRAAGGFSFGEIRSCFTEKIVQYHSLGVNGR